MLCWVIMTTTMALNLPRTALLPVWGNAPRVAAIAQRGRFVMAGNDLQPRSFPPYMQPGLCT